MAMILRSLPQYQDILEEYSWHLNNMLKIAKTYKDTNYKSIFEYEQAIVTWKKKNGDDMNFYSLTDNEAKKLTANDPEERIRLGLLGHFAEKLTVN